MSKESHEARVRAAFEAFNARELEDYVDLYANPATHIDADTGAESRFTREENLAANRAYLAIFPDLTCKIQTLVADGDTVMVRYLNRATHTGRTDASVRIYGEPKGVEVAWSIVSEYRFRGDAVAELAVVSSSLSLLRQLGVLAWPPRPEAQDQA